MNTILLASCAAAALALPGFAEAKELDSATFCGVSACRTVKEPKTLHFLPTGGERTEALGPAVPYYRLRFDFGQGHASDLYYVPSTPALVAPGESGELRSFPIVGAPAANLMRSLTAGLEPIALPRVTSVAFGDRILRGDAAATYLSLYELQTPAKAGWGSDDWVGIDLRSSQPSPWTDAGEEFAYSPSQHALARQGNFLLVPGALASHLGARRSLEAGGGALAAWLAAAVVVAALVAVGAAALRRASRSRFSPASPS